MIVNLKKYIVGLYYRFKTKVDVDRDFYDDDIYLIDLESEKNV